MLSAKEQQLLDALEPRAVTEGVDIVTIEIVGGKKSPTIRVYIDVEGGVGFDELVSAQEWIDKIVEDIDPFPGAYTLEVHSPGIDRPLRTPAHFMRFVGEDVYVVTTRPIEGRSRFNGVLESADESNICVECDDVSFNIEYSDIKKAHVKGKFEFR